MRARNIAGLAHLTSQLLTDGTAKRSALQISETLDFIGASLDTGCGDDLATISMTILKKDLGVGLQLLAEILTGANFPPAEIDRQKQAIIASIRAKEEDPGALAGDAFAAALFPEQPLWPAGGRNRGFGKTAGSATACKNFLSATIGPIGRSWRWSAMFRNRKLARRSPKSIKNWTKGEATRAPTAPAQIGSRENRCGSTKI